MDCSYLKHRICQQFLAQFWRSSCAGQLICRSCHTARVDSQHESVSYLSVTLTVCELHTAWTISRSLRLRGYVGESTLAGFWRTTHRLVLTAIVTWHHSNTPTNSVTCDSTHVAVVIVVNLLTLTHCQGLP